MSTFALQVFTGPFTAEVANRLRAAKVHIAFVGKENLILHGEGSNIDVARARMVEDLSLMFASRKLHPRKV